MMKRFFPRMFVIAAIVGMGGCASMKESDTARTGLEQLLISSAVDESLDKVNLAPLSGAKVFLKTDYLDSVDKNYVIVSLRSRLLKHNCTLVDKADDAMSASRSLRVVSEPIVPIYL